MHTCSFSTFLVFAWPIILSVQEYACFHFQMSRNWNIGLIWPYSIIYWNNVCMSDIVYGAVLGLNYTVASLLIHKIASNTYIMCFKWAPKDSPVFYKSVAYCTWSSFHSQQTQKKTLTSYVFGLIRRMLRNKKFQLLIQITHCQVHIPCTDACVKAMQIYVKFNINSIHQNMC